MNRNRDKTNIKTGRRKSKKMKKMLWLDHRLKFLKRIYKIDLGEREDNAIENM